MTPPDGYDISNDETIMLFAHFRVSLAELLTAFPNENHHEYVTWKFNKINTDWKEWTNNLNWPDGVVCW